MEIEYDPDSVGRVQLNADAAGMAVEAAGDFAHAGMDEHEQLMQGVRAYLWHCKVASNPAIASIDPAHSVQIPLTIEEANAMVTIGNHFIARELANGEDRS